MKKKKKKKRTVRFHIECRHVRGRTRDQDTWLRESIAGAKTLTEARADLRQLRREGPSYFTRADWRIVKVTSTTEIV